jgi:hypothetical protein
VVVGLIQFRVIEIIFNCAVLCYFGLVSVMSVWVRFI